MEYIVVGIFVIGLIVRGFRWLLRQTNSPQKPLEKPLAPPPLSQMPQNPFQAAPPFQPSQAPFPGQDPLQSVRPTALTQAQAFQQQQALQQRQQAGRREQIQPRQPSAGGPAVPIETSRQDFVRQEQELFASEPAALGVSLTSSASAAAAPNALFGETDDLVRAIILQEVLGPPLSRRKSPPPPPAP